MKLLPLAFFLILISCAKKPLCDTSYPEPLSQVPESFRIYGYVSSVYGKTPFLLAKENGEYELKVGTLGNLRLYADTLCYGDECYDLPVRFEDLIFANLLKGNEKVICKGNIRVFKGEGVRVVFKNGLPVSLKIDNALSVSFLAFSKEGFVKSLEINLADYRLSVVIEKAERLR